MNVICHKSVCSRKLNVVDNKERQQQYTILVVFLCVSDTVPIFKYRPVPFYKRTQGLSEECLPLLSTLIIPVGLHQH